MPATGIRRPAVGWPVVVVLVAALLAAQRAIEAEPTRSVVVLGLGLTAVVLAAVAVADGHRAVGREVVLAAAAGFALGDLVSPWGFIVGVPLAVAVAYAVGHRLAEPDVRH